MEKVRIGRNKKNDIVYQDPSISNFHLEVERKSDKEYLIVDQNSSNGTYINEVPVNSGILQVSDRLRLGTFEVQTAGLFVKVNTLVNKNKTDFRKEYAELMQRFEEYQNKKNKVLKPSMLPIVLRLGLGVVIILILLVFPSLIPEKARYPLMMAVGLISVLTNVLGNSQVKKNEKLDLLKLEYEEELVCPKCRCSMINHSITYWKGKKSCAVRKCDAIFQD